MIVWGGLSAIWAVDSELSLRRFIKFLSLYLGLWLLFAAANATGGTRTRRLVLVLGTGWTVAALLLVLEVYFDGGVWLQTVRGPWLHDVAALKALKRGSTVLLILSWPLALGLYKWRYRLAAVSVLLSPGYFLMLIGATAGMIAWVAGLVVALLVWVIPRKASLKLTIVTGLIVMATPVPVSMIPSDLTDLTNWISSPGIHRLAMWKFTGDRIGERPVIGWGLENSRVVPGGRTIVPIADWVRQNPKTIEEHPSLPGFLADNPPEFLPLHPHNFVLQIWLELGFLGILLAAATAGTIFQIIHRAALSKTACAASYGMITACFSIAYLSYGAWQTWWLSSVILAIAFMIAISAPGSPNEATNHSAS